MLSQVSRITKKKDFEAIFKLGKTVKDGFLLFRILKNNLNQSRLAFVVSKKISDKATVRNKVRRRIRESFSVGSFEGKDPVDVLVIALSGIEKREFAEIKSSVSRFLEKLK